MTRSYDRGIADENAREHEMRQGSQYQMEHTVKESKVKECGQDEGPCHYWRQLTTIINRQYNLDKGMKEIINIGLGVETNKSMFLARFIQKTHKVDLDVRSICTYPR